MKGLIVLDKIPKHCGECNLAQENYCPIRENFVLYYIKHKEKPRSCPIKQVTGYTDESDSLSGHQTAYGWNLCMSHHGML